MIPDTSAYPYGSITPAQAARIASSFKRELRLTGRFTGPWPRSGGGYRQIVVRADPTRLDPKLGVKIDLDGRVIGMGFIASDEGTKRGRPDRPQRPLDDSFELDFTALDIRALPVTNKIAEHATKVVSQDGPFWRWECSCGDHGRWHENRKVPWRQSVEHREAHTPLPDEEQVA